MKIGHVVVPTDDLDVQLGFYELLGLSIRFRDGDRYAAVTDGSVTLGLADESQQPSRGQVVVSFEVDDLDSCLARLATAGWVPGEITVGPHERRSLVLDPSGNPIAVYEKRP